MLNAGQQKETVRAYRKAVEEYLKSDDLAESFQWLRDVSAGRIVYRTGAGEVDYRARLDCTRELHNRTFGKPVEQVVVAQGEVGQTAVDQMSEEEVRRELERLEKLGLGEASKENVVKTIGRVKA